MQENDEYSWQEWIEAFNIFAKYDKTWLGTINAEHDEIFIGINPRKVSKEDKARLKQLGWDKDNDAGYFSRSV